MFLFEISLRKISMLRKSLNVAQMCHFNSLQFIITY